MIITKKPDMSKVKWSKAQKKNRQHMSDAIFTAQVALLEPKVKAKYERKAKKLGRRAWNLALFRRHERQGSVREEVDEEGDPISPQKTQRSRRKTPIKRASFTPWCPSSCT